MSTDTSETANAVTPSLLLNGGLLPIGVPPFREQVSWAERKSHATFVHRQTWHAIRFSFVDLRGANHIDADVPSAPVPVVCPN